NIEGVIAVEKFLLPLKTDSSFSNFTQWINIVKDKQKKPKLDVENSNVTFTRQGDRYRHTADKQPDKQMVKAIYSFLQSADYSKKLKGYAKDFKIPRGEFMDIADYYPIQKNLPS